MEEEYINFGDEQVSKQDLLKAIGDYKAYSSTQPWSAARRGAFDAVIELALNRGILGTRKYTNPDTGESMYYATFGGDPFDINTYDKNTRRGWQDATGFIGKLAESLPTKKSIEEKKKKEEEDRIAKLPTFDSNSFLSTLYKNISDKEFGGQAFDGKTFDMNRWNTLDDVRDEKTGAVGTDKRKEALAKYLEDIDRDFNAEEYNWKDSPFKDADDFKSRLGEAVRALRSPELDDDTPALNKLGINYKDWFNNRTGEVYTTDEQGNPITYGTYYRGLQNQKDAKIQAANAKAEAARKAYNANLIGGLRWHYGKGLTGSPLSPENSNLNYLNELAAKDSWTGDELSQLVGVFKLAQRNNALQNLSKEELATFGPRFGSNPNRFKKIDKLNGIYWDSLINQIAKPYKQGQQSSINFQNILDKNNPEYNKKIQEEKAIQEQNKYLQNTEWTADQTRELAGIAADVASVIDPEPVSAGVLALTGTGLRTWNRAFDKDGFTLTDAGHTALDAGLSLLGMIPVVGDAALAARVIGKLQKAAGWLGAAFAATSVPQAAKAAWNKVVNGQDMTVDDWRAIGNVLMGATQARRIQLNRAAGNAVKNQSGGVKTEKAAEVEVKIGDKTEKVQISKQEADELKKSYKKAGNNLEETSKALKNSRAVRRELEAKKNSDGKSTYTKEQIENIEAPQAASGSIRGRFPVGRDTRGIKDITRSVNIEGTTINKNSPLRLQYMNNNTGFWGRGNYGWNINGNKGENWNKLKTWWQRLKNPYEQPKVSETKLETPKSTTEPSKTTGSKTSAETPKSETSPKKSWSEIEKGEKQWTMDESMKEWKNILKGEQKSLAIGENFKAGDFHFNVMGHSGSEKGIVEINFGSKKESIKFENQKDLRKKVLKFMKENAPKITVDGKSKYDAKKMGEILRQLKAKGVFKQGGRLDKQRIQQYKEFIKK